MYQRILKRYCPLKTSNCNHAITHLYLTSSEFTMDVKEIVDSAGKSACKYSRMNTCDVQVKEEPKDEEFGCTWIKTEFNADEAEFVDIPLKTEPKEENDTGFNLLTAEAIAEVVDIPLKAEPNEEEDTGFNLLTAEAIAEVVDIPLKAEPNEEEDTGFNLLTAEAIAEVVDIPLKAEPNEEEDTGLNPLVFAETPAELEDMAELTEEDDMDSNPLVFGETLPDNIAANDRGHCTRENPCKRQTISKSQKKKPVVVIIPARVIPKPSIWAEIAGMYFFECSSCLTVFSTLGDYNNHQHNLTAKKWEYKCDVCLHSFIEKKDIRIHMRIHAGERIYSCGACEKRIYKKDLLIEHISRHYKGRPYKCEICPKAFTKEAILMVHMNRVHVHGPRHSCPMCEKKFDDNAKLKTHVRACKSLHTNRNRPKS